jgi:CRP-like cAMP-binding protein
MNQPELADSCLHCLQKCDAFQALNTKEMEILHATKYDTVYRAGEVIAKQGAPISHLVSLNEGLAKIVLETPGKQDIIVSLEKPVYVLTGPGLFVDNRYHFSVIAVTECRTCYLEIQELHNLIDSNPDFARRFYKTVGEKTIMLYNRIRSLNQKNMAGRISEALLFLHDTIFQTNPFDITLTRQELAEFTGMTKESVSRILKEFKEEGLIETEEKRVEILDLEKLTSISKKG